ncbi:hypothetical protein COOONC_01366 [Cooperia oncophora]
MITATSTTDETDSVVYDGPESKLAGTFQQLPLSEIQTLAEQPRPAVSAKASSLKRLPKIRLRGARMNSINAKDKRKSLPVPVARPKTVVSAPSSAPSQSALVGEALTLATSKGLRGGYIEFMRSNTDESIKQSL